MAPPAPPKPKAPKPKAKPKGPPSLNSYLAGDTAYKQQTDAANKAIADYATQMGAQTAAYNTDYTANTRNLTDQHKIDNTASTDDFAARGLIRSGMFVKDNVDRNVDYTKRQATLDQGKAEFASNLNFGQTNFNSTQNLNKQRYRNEAIQRRAAKYNL